MAADRAEHIAEVVRPGLQQGAWVVSDRFIPSSLAYQGVGRGLGVAEVEQLNELASAGLVPDLVVVLDLSPEVARERMAAMRARTPRPARARGRRLRARGARGLPRPRAKPRLGARRRVGRRRRRGAGSLGCRGGASRAVSIAGWDRVVGQDAAVAQLKGAIGRPVHAYLLVGPRGSGVDEAARCFAASLDRAVIDDERELGSGAAR